MSDSAQVHSIQALEELKAGLSRFRAECQEALDAAGLEIRRTLDGLAERQRDWQRQVQQRQAELSQAQAALARCQASGYTDSAGDRHSPDCSAHQRALARAQERLREAEAALRQVVRWTQVVYQAQADYEQQAQRLAALLDTELPKAAALLGGKITTLQAYIAMKAPSGKSPREFPE